MGQSRAEIRGEVSVTPYRGESLGQEVGERPQGEVGIHQEAQEVGECLHRHAVRRPGAVVVHLGDASTAVPAVMGPERFGGIAFLAPAESRRTSSGLVRGRRRRRRRRGEYIATRIDSDGFVVSPPETKNENVECGGLFGC